jgi:kynurenine 3-monooxygenase
MGKHLTIFGAGLAGALMAVFLARRGHRVDLFERRPDPRAGTPERGRSINLALSTRGIDALSRVNLEREVLSTAIPMRGRMIHPPVAEPRLTLLPYSQNPDHHINSVSRWGLNLLLLDAASREPNVRVHFGQRCVDMDLSSGACDVLDVASNMTRRVATRHVIAADGAFSAVRGAMQKRDRFEYSQSYLPHGYKELTIPPGPGGSFRMEKHALHIWPRGTYMMIALPNQDGSFTCTLFWPFEGPHSFAALKDNDDAVRAFFDRHFPDAVPLIPDLVSDWRHNPTSSLVTVRCWPWHVGDRAVLIGDAAHAVVPFYGQGMNASFEDCVALDAALAQHADVAEAFAAYGEARKRNADALAQLAVDNFIEMRDKVNAFTFRRRSMLEKALARRLEGYKDLYERVTFSTQPYADAARSAREQAANLAAALRDDAPRESPLRRTLEATLAEVFPAWYAPTARLEREMSPAEAAERDGRQRRAVRRLLGHP